jgi:hypothetical protein
MKTDGPKSPISSRGLRSVYTIHKPGFRVRVVLVKTEPLRNWAENDRCPLEGEGRRASASTHQRGI